MQCDCNYMQITTNISNYHSPRCWIGVQTFRYKSCHLTARIQAYVCILLGY